MLSLFEIAFQSRKETLEMPALVMGGERKKEKSGGEAEEMDFFFEK